MDSDESRAGSAGRSLAVTVFFGVALVNAGLLWYFHDRYWYPTDDGFYAHVAERLIAGDVLNRDIQDVHPGYIHILHALTFRIFGFDMVSLRYPLIFAAFITAAMTYVLLQRRGVWLAAVGSFLLLAVGVVQFVDPTPNWYGPLFCVVLVWWLTSLPPSNGVRLFGAGFLIGALTLFRQLTGVWVAMGVLFVVLLERSRAEDRRGGWLGRGLLLVMIAALLGYLAMSPETEPGGVVLFAVWPLAILGWGVAEIRVSNRETGRVLWQMALGFVVAAVPLVLYHLTHGSLIYLFNDTVTVALGHTRLPFFGENAWYGALPIAGLHLALTSFDPVQIVNGLYWAALPTVSALNGMLVVRKLWRGAASGDLVLPVVAAFYGLVSLYFEGPLYLYYSVGLTLVALLWQAAAGSRRIRVGLALAAVGISAVAIAYHAGQSRDRTAVEILRGHRITSLGKLERIGLARASLRLEPGDGEVYRRVVDVIEARSTPDEAILALPNDAELYFLSKRRNPFRFYNSAMGITTAADLEAILSILQSNPPRLVLFRTEDKFNTEASLRVMTRVREIYQRIDKIGGLEIYVRP